MPTTLDKEREEQRRWIAHAAGTAAGWAERLLDNEFQSESAQRDAENRRLSRLVRLAVEQVPYYRRVFEKLGMGAAEIRSAEDLAALPVLTKTQVHEAGEALRPLSLPAGEHPVVERKTTGHSGPPARYWRSAGSRLLELVIGQRLLRWGRFDPAQTLAWIRKPQDMRFLPDRRLLPPGETLQCPCWPGVGKLFRTGKFLGFSIYNGPDAKVQWLERHRPAYLRATCSELEQLALLFQDRDGIPGLRALRAAAEPLTRGMRRRIESTFQVKVHLSYGTDELGWFATHCLEGDRNHVHTENALVEILNEAGRPCAPGEWGRIVVTVVGNLAMPLIRLDTGDVAQAVTGPCPCGRILPGFGPEIERYSARFATSPDVRLVVSRLREAMESLPASLAKPLRKYQICQSRSGEFELRIVLAGSLSSNLVAHMKQVWSSCDAPPASRFRIKVADDLPRAPNGKFYYFVNDAVAADGGASRANGFASG